MYDIYQFDFLVTDGGGVDNGNGCAAQMSWAIEMLLDCGTKDGYIEVYLHKCDDKGIPDPFTNPDYITSISYEDAKRRHEEKDYSLLIFGETYNFI